MLPPPPLDRLRRPFEREEEPEKTDEEVRCTARRVWVGSISHAG